MSEPEEPSTQPAVEWFRQAVAEAERNHLREIEASAVVRAELERIRQEVAHKEEQLLRLASELDRRKHEIDAIHRTLSWRLTKPLRIGKAAPRRLGAKLANVLAGAVRRTKLTMARAIRPAVHWIVRRPRLFLLLRRTVAAHPRIRNFVKGRIVANQFGLKPAAAGVLTADARFVLQDLERAIADASRASGDDFALEPDAPAFSHRRADGQPDGPT